MKISRPSIPNKGTNECKDLRQEKISGFEEPRKD